MTENAYPRIAELEDDGAREREVYARYGLAMFHAQVFETDLVNLIVWGEFERAVAARDRDFDSAARREQLALLVLGQLLRLSQQRVGLQESDMKMFREAVKVRN